MGWGGILGLYKTDLFPSGVPCSAGLFLASLSSGMPSLRGLHKASLINEARKKLLQDLAFTTQSIK